jgi:hypothetical protein
MINRRGALRLLCGLPLIRSFVPAAVPVETIGYWHIVDVGRAPLAALTTTITTTIKAIDGDGVTEFVSSPSFQSALRSTFDHHGRVP